MKKRFTLITAALMLLVFLTPPCLLTAENQQVMKNIGFEENVLALPDRGGEPMRDNYSYTFTAKQFTANDQTKVLGGINWTLAGNGGYWGYDDTKGQQFGSSGSPYRSLSLTTSGINGTINSIVVNASTANSATATISCTVNGSAFGTQSQSLSNSNTAYTFSGSASGAIVISIAQPSTSKALYIKSISVTYSVGSTYTVTYDANGGTGEVPTDGLAYANGASVTVKDRNTLDHATLGFKGWNTAADGTGTFYNPGDTFTMGSSNLTLYAVYSTRCTFAYNGNGNTNGDVPTGYYTSYGSGAKVTVLDNTGSLEKTNSVWEGWNTAADGSGTTYVADDNFTITANTTLYAKWRALNTYTLVTNVNQIVPGKHYIIASSKTDGVAKAMGSQGDNNRAAAEVTVSSSIITEADGVYEFVISGPETISLTDYYTIYDENALSTGYLYAPNNSSKNYLKTRNNIGDDDKAIWKIVIDGESNQATIQAKVEGRNLMRFNSTIFSCYSSGQDPIYLYKKNTNDPNYDYYSPTTLASLTIGSTEVCTVHNNAVLNVSSLTNEGTASNLIIENGAQLIHGNAGVAATVEKSVIGVGPAVWTTADDDWYFIASPIVGSLAVGSLNLGTTYDLYRLNNSNNKWENIHNLEHSSDFTSIDNGRGYLYANVNDHTLAFAGNLKPYSEAGTDNQVSVAAGANLIGNPFACNVYANRAFYRMNAEGTGITAVASYTTTPIKPCEGIVIDAAEAGSVTFTKNAPSLSSHGGSLQIVLTEVNTRSNAVMDNAIITFDEGTTLPKFRFGGNAEVYFTQRNEDYAIAYSDKKGEMPLHFKATKDGSYTLSITQEEVELTYLHLIDKLTGNDIDLLATPEYTFSAKNGDGENRFRLVFEANGNALVTSNEPFAYFNGSEWVIENDGNATLQVIDVMGRMLRSENVSGNATTSLPNLSAGVYVLRLVNSESIRTQKVVIE